MRVSSQVVGGVLGLLVVCGCSSTDSTGQLADDGGDTKAGASTGGSSPGTGGQGGVTSASAGSGGLSGSHHDGSGGLAGRAAGGGGGLDGAGGTPGHRFSIRFDYRFDTVGFFTSERRVALEAAGAAWSKLIHDDFAPVPKGTGIRLRNPENRDEYLWLESIEEDIDDVLVFVGTSEAIPGLGRGGPSGTTQTDDAALAAALAARQTGADFEPWAGSITFKASSNFYFDQTPETADDISPEGFDFTSVAAHELGHVLGFASCAAFTNLTSGTFFTGTAAQANFGGPVPLTPDSGHFQDHLQSNGGDTLMDPGTSNGVRVMHTPLDRAVFIDLGYEISN